MILKGISWDGLYTVCMCFVWISRFSGVHENWGLSCKCNGNTVY
jgi:hypothetical protein